MKPIEQAPIYSLTELLEELKKKLEENFLTYCDGEQCTLTFADEESPTGWVEVDLVDYLDTISEMLGKSFADIAYIETDIEDEYNVILVPDMNWI